MSGDRLALRLATLGILSTLSLTAFATPQQLIAPTCLLKQVNLTYKTLAANSDFSFVEINAKDISAFIAAKNNRQANCGGFMNVTRAWQQWSLENQEKKAASFLDTHLPTHKISRKATISYHIQYEKEVNALLQQLNPQDMWNNLTTLTNFKDRYANSDNGVKTAEWIKTQVETIAKNNHRNDVSIYTIATGNEYKQPSVIAKIGDSTEPGIVVSAHMDTLDSNFSRKPGADDDGTGTVTVLETAQTILASQMHFKKPIYFIWYAAEEEGLVGSDYVVSTFKQQNIPVAAVLHFDLTGYAYKNDPAMWLIKDNVNLELTDYLETLIKTYVKQPVKYTKCGYACSDHATWTKYGYAASIPAETAYETTNPNIHTSRDTMDKLSLTHMTDYLKLATAFVVELAEPNA